MEGAKDGACPHQIGSPPPCSTMREALCCSGVQGTSKQGKEAATSLDQVGTRAPVTEKTSPSQLGCLSSPRLALYFAFCIFSCVLLNYFKCWSSCERPQATPTAAPKADYRCVPSCSPSACIPGEHVRRSQACTAAHPVCRAEGSFLRLLDPGQCLEP